MSDDNPKFDHWAWQGKGKQRRLRRIISIRDGAYLFRSGRKWYPESELTGPNENYPTPELIVGSTYRLRSGWYKRYDNAFLARNYYYLMSGGEPCSWVAEMDFGYGSMAYDGHVLMTFKHPEYNIMTQRLWHADLDLGPKLPKFGRGDTVYYIGPSDGLLKPGVPYIVSAGMQIVSVCVTDLSGKSPYGRVAFKGTGKEREDLSVYSVGLSAITAQWYVSEEYLTSTAPAPPEEIEEEEEENGWITRFKVRVPWEKTTRIRLK